MERLKELRLQKGLYQKDIAAMLGVDRTTYVKYENGSSEPSFDILDKLAQYFNVSVDYLLGRDKKSNNIKSLRLEKKMTQAELGCELGITQGELSNWENGKYEPDVASLNKMARIFDTTIDNILGLEKSANEKSPASEDEELVEYLEELKTRPEMKMLFSLAKGATKKDVEDAVAIIEALRKRNDGDA